MGLLIDHDGEDLCVQGLNESDKVVFPRGVPCWVEQYAEWPPALHDVGSVEDHGVVGVAVEVLSLQGLQLGLDRRTVGSVPHDGSRERQIPNLRMRDVAVRVVARFVDVYA